MQCPGQDNRYWDGSAVFEIPCPSCGTMMEFFKDDSQRTCKQCGQKVLNPRMDFGCASYCSHAKQCLGAMAPEYIAKQKHFLQDALTAKVRKQLAGRKELLKRTLMRVEFVERLCEQEQDGFVIAIVAAALLVDCSNPLELLFKVSKDPQITDTVEALLHKRKSEQITAPLSAAIFDDACVLSEIATISQQRGTAHTFQTKHAHNLLKTTKKTD